MYTPPPTPSSLCALLWRTNTQEMLPLVTMLGPQRSQRPIYLYVPVHGWPLCVLWEMNSTQKFGVHLSQEMSGTNQPLGRIFIIKKR